MTVLADPGGPHVRLPRRLGTGLLQRRYASTAIQVQGTGRGVVKPRFQHTRRRRVARGNLTPGLPQNGA
jgi:hypothetical protein